MFSLKKLTTLVKVQMTIKDTKSTNVDDVVQEKLRERNANWPNSSIQNIYTWRRWVRKKKFVIQFNNLATRY